MKSEFITAIENLGFRLNPANVHQLQFGNQLLNIYKPCGILYKNTSLVLEWLNREDEDSGFTKLIKYIKEPNINEVELLVTEATELHYKVDNNRNDMFQKLISTYGNEILMHKKSMLDFVLKDSISYNVARSKVETYQRVLQDLIEMQKHLNENKLFIQIETTIVSSNNLFRDLSFFVENWNKEQPTKDSCIKISSFTSNLTDDKYFKEDVPF